MAPQSSLRQLPILTKHQPEISDSVALHSLCDHCKRVWAASATPAPSAKINTDDDEEKPGLRLLPHCNNLRELRESGGAGCHLCSLAYAARIKTKEQDPTETTEDDGTLEATIKGDPPSAVVFQSRERVVAEIPVLHMPVDSIIPKVIAECEFSLRRSTGSSETMRVALGWLQHCITTHTRCNTRYQTTSDAKWLPTRLVDVGVSTNSGPGIPRLVLTESLEDRVEVQYLTLSHSWGKAVVFRLLTGNMEELQSQIPVGKLSKTFQHAMEITRLLGYQYLWIDSLCIMQDSSADWDKEAVTMTDVYGNSSCNIAALGASGDAGCFTARDPLALYPCLLPSPDPADPSSDSSGSRYFAFRHPQLNLGVLDSAPLLSRAWVVQERLVSPRNLYFGGPDGLVWECCEHGLTESWPLASSPLKAKRLEPGSAEGLPRKIAFEGVLEPITLPAGQRPAVGAVGPDYTSFLDAWHHMLGHYTETNLTFTSDRLVALAGIARAIQRRTGLSYTAGTWIEMLPHDLLWHGPEESTPRSTPSGAPGAPSWSWAAREGQVRFHDPYSTDVYNTRGAGMKAPPYFARMVDREEPSAPSALALNRNSDEGDISPASIAVAGRLLRGLIRRKARGTCRVRCANGRSCEMYADDELLDKKPVFLLLISRVKSGWAGRLQKDNSGIYERGIVLAQRSGGVSRSKGEDGGYVRVGYFTTKGNSWSKNVFDGNEEEEEVVIY
ncbi:heterokaryon incompatibility protein-domain-containing protein [Lasiosphaeria hispida]|uniref:Heterokaryon incompatibility protein-domain-containing protein n=1 Tax=Lasiosphaeria hispida TaxID=260671 RepID=A0AAJ0HEF0_9PEZI|nr:heterokaryon incompatibility protein-domain-containing protein [Lasiosphaeria hispida]